MFKLRLILKQIFCRHKYQLIAVIYGDEIIHRDYKRYACGCLKCGVISYRRTKPW